MDAVQGVSKPHSAPPRDRSRRIAFGIDGLDNVLHGGLPAGHVYILEGTPGAGKTTIALQFALHSRVAGLQPLYISLSESRRELLAVGDSHGWDLEGIPIYELTPQEDSLKPEHQYSVFNPEDVELNQITDLIARKVEEVHPDVVVIDSLSELRLLARDGFRYRRQILGLKVFCEERGITVLMVDNYLGGRDPQLHSIAHGVIALERSEREYGSERRRLHVLKIRGSRFREGYHDYRILTGGVVVHPRLVAAEYRQPQGPEVLSTGIAELDAMLGGGLSRGTSTLVVGASGVGKSSLTARFVMSALRRGESAVIYIFDESRPVYLQRNLGLGIDFRPFLEQGKLLIQPLDPAEMPPGEFIDGIRTCVSEKQVSVVVIDSLSGWLHAMPGEGYLQLQMHELLSYLGMHGVSTFLILPHQGVLGPMHAGVDISYLADSIILLRYFEAEGQVRKAISVFKKRTGAHESTIREFHLQPGSIVVGDPLTAFRGVLTGVPEYLDKAKFLLQRDDKP